MLHLHHSALDVTIAVVWDRVIRGAKHMRICLYKISILELLQISILFLKNKYK